MKNILFFLCFCAAAHGYAVPKFGSPSFVKWVQKELDVLTQISKDLPEEKWIVPHPNLENVKRSCMAYASFLRDFINRTYRVPAARFPENPISALSFLLKEKPAHSSLSLLSKAIDAFIQEKEKQKCFLQTPFISCFYNASPQCFESSFMMASLAKLAGVRSATISTIVYPNSLATHAVCLLDLSHDKEAVWYVVDSNFPGVLQPLEKAIGYDSKGYSKPQGKIYPLMSLYLLDRGKPSYVWLSSWKKSEGASISALPEKLEEAEIHLQYLERLSNHLLSLFLAQDPRYRYEYGRLIPFIRRFEKECARAFPGADSNFYFLYHKAGISFLKFLHLHQKTLGKKEGDIPARDWNFLTQTYHETIQLYLRSLEQGITIKAVFRLTYLFNFYGKYEESFSLLQSFEKKEMWPLVRLLKVMNYIECGLHKEAKEYYREISEKLPRDVAHVVPSHQDMEYIRQTLDSISTQLAIKTVPFRSLKIGNRK